MSSLLQRQGSLLRHGHNADRKHLHRIASDPIEDGEVQRLNAKEARARQELASLTTPEILDNENGETGGETTSDAATSGAAMTGAEEDMESAREKSPVDLALTYDPEGRIVTIKETQEMSLVRAELERIAAQKRAVAEVVKVLTDQAVMFRDQLNLNTADEIASLRKELSDFRRVSAKETSKEHAAISEMHSQMGELSEKYDADEEALRRERRKEMEELESFNNQKTLAGDRLHNLATAKASSEAELKARIKRLTAKLLSVQKKARDENSESEKRTANLDTKLDAEKEARVKLTSDLAAEKKKEQILEDRIDADKETFRTKMAEVKEEEETLKGKLEAATGAATGASSGSGSALRPQSKNGDNGADSDGDEGDDEGGDDDEGEGEGEDEDDPDSQQEARDEADARKKINEVKEEEQAEDVE